jgi:signal transduction histidine kinase
MIDVPDDLVLITYPGVWTQIVNFFVDNSLKHGFSADEGGQVVISATTQQGQQHFSYRDNGTGMSQEQVKRVFDPFFTTNRGEGGTGLGMHIVFNLVSQKLAGQVTATSEPGQGVTFTIDTPLALVQA